MVLAAPNALRGGIHLPALRSYPRTFVLFGYPCIHGSASLSIKLKHSETGGVTPFFRPSISYALKSSTGSNPAVLQGYRRTHGSTLRVRGPAYRSHSRHGCNRWSYEQLSRANVTSHATRKSLVRLQNQNDNRISKRGGNIKRKIV